MVDDTVRKTNARLSKPKGALSKPNASMPKPVETQCDCRNLVETTMRQVISTLSKRARFFLASPPPFLGEYGHTGGGGRQSRAYVGWQRWHSRV